MRRCLGNMWSDQACEMPRYGGVFSSSNVSRVESCSLSSRTEETIVVHRSNAVNSTHNFVAGYLSTLHSKSHLWIEM